MVCTGQLERALHHSWHWPCIGTAQRVFFPSCSFPVFFPGCSFPGVLSRVFRPGCSFPYVLSIAQRVFFLGIAIHSRARESHPPSLRAPVCSYAPSVARQLRPLWPVICALGGTLSVLAVARHLCPLWAHLHPLGFFLNPPGPLLTHLYTVYMACSECLLTRLNPLAERTCFSQVGPVVGSALSARDMRLPYAGPAAPGHTRPDPRPKQLRPRTKRRTAIDSAIRADIGDLPFLGVLMSIVSLCYLFSQRGTRWYIGDTRTQHYFQCSSLRAESRITLRVTIDSVSVV